MLGQWPDDFLNHTLTISAYCFEGILEIRNEASTTVFPTMPEGQKMCLTNRLWFYATQAGL